MFRGSSHGPLRIDRIRAGWIVHGLGNYLEARTRAEAREILEALKTGGIQGPPPLRKSHHGPPREGFTRDRGENRQEEP